MPPPAWCGSPPGCTPSRRWPATGSAAPSPRGGGLPPEFFGEGICRVGEHIWQLTWQERVALRWRLSPLKLCEKVPYNREGWGIAAVGDYVLTSDGSSELVRRDARTLRPLATVIVRLCGRRVLGLNDLAWSAGRVWANVIGTHYLAGIDPDTGEVTNLVGARRVAERIAATCRPS